MSDPNSAFPTPSPYDGCLRWANCKGGHHDPRCRHYDPDAPVTPRAALSYSAIESETPRVTVVTFEPSHVCHICGFDRAERGSQLCSALHGGRASKGQPPVEPSSPIEAVTPELQQPKGFGISDCQKCGQFLNYDHQCAEPFPYTTPVVYRRDLEWCRSCRAARESGHVCYREGP